MTAPIDRAAEAINGGAETSGVHFILARRAAEALLSDEDEMEKVVDLAFGDYLNDVLIGATRITQERAIVGALKRYLLQESATAWTVPS